MSNYKQINISAETLQSKVASIGDVSSLETTEQDELVDAVNEVNSNADAAASAATGAQSTANSATTQSDTARAKVDNLEEECAELAQRDYSELPLLCGQPPILFGNGTPAEATVPTNWIQLADGGYNWNGLPSAIGQQYHNTASDATNRRYIAVSDGNGGLTWQN